MNKDKKNRKDANLSTKARNPVAKNANAAIGGGGYGAHKDKKKAMKQGDVKHKKQEYAESLQNKLDSALAEATGDPKFDKIIKDITSKKAVVKQQKADTKQRARDAFGSMFGGNPADKLKIREQNVTEELEIGPAGPGEKIQRGYLRPGKDNNFLSWRVDLAAKKIPRDIEHINDLKNYLAQMEIYASYSVANDYSDTGSAGRQKDKATALRKIPKIKADIERLEAEKAKGDADRDWNKEAEYHAHQGYHPDRPDDWNEGTELDSEYYARSNNWGLSAEDAQYILKYMREDEDNRIEDLIDRYPGLDDFLDDHRQYQMDSYYWEIINKSLNNIEDGGIEVDQVDEGFNSKQEVIDHFVKQGKSAASGAMAWEHGWRGVTKSKPKTAKAAAKKKYWWTDKDESIEEELTIPPDDTPEYDQFIRRGGIDQKTPFDLGGADAYYGRQHDITQEYGFKKGSPEWDEYIQGYRDTYQNSDMRKDYGSSRSSVHPRRITRTQEATEAYTPSPAKPFRNPPGFNKQGTGVGNKLAQQTRAELAKKKQAKVSEAEGEPGGLPHLTRKLAQHIAKQIDKEGAHAIVKSVQWGDGAADELVQFIKAALLKHAGIGLKRVKEASALTQHRQRSAQADKDLAKREAARKKNPGAASGDRIKELEKRYPAKEGQTHDSLADRLFEHERTYEEKLQNQLDRLTKK